MKILLITQWYKPVRGAVKRMVRIAEHLAENNEVTVLTGFPNYPSGVLPKKYKWKLWTKEKDNQVNIIRTYEYPAPIDNLNKRLLNYASFLISSLTAVLFMSKQDIIIVSSPSFFSGITGLLAKKIFKAKFYFDVRDLWPDSLIEMNLINNGKMIKILEMLEKSFYKNAEKIFVATPAILNHLVTEKIPSEKLVLLLNSVDTDFFKPEKKKKSDEFIVFYAGNHGKIQNLKPLVLAARNLADYPKIKFHLVGEGDDKKNLQFLATKLNLKNILFSPEKSPKELLLLINRSDLCFLALANKPIFQEAFPTKCAEYLSCGKPVVAGVSGALKDYIESGNVGFTFKTDDANQLATLILKIYKNPRLQKKNEHECSSTHLKSIFR